MAASKGHIGAIISLLLLFAIMGSGCHATRVGNADVLPPGGGCNIIGSCTSRDDCVNKCSAQSFQPGGFCFPNPLPGGSGNSCCCIISRN